MTEQEKLDIKNAIDGKLSDDLADLEVLLKNLSTEKAAASDHGRFKRIDKAMEKVQMKMRRLQQ